jgi:hypothetical protein
MKNKQSPPAEAHLIGLDQDTGHKEFLAAAVHVNRKKNWPEIRIFLAKNFIKRKEKRARALKLLGRALKFTKN